MVTGLWIALEFGPDAGKQSGETWLLWQMLDQLKPGDTLVADCFYCTYWLVAACKNKGANIVMKNHHKREDHPLGARQLHKQEMPPFSFLIDTTFGYNLLETPIWFKTAFV